MPDTWTAEWSDWLSGCWKAISVPSVVRSVIVLCWYERCCEIYKSQAVEKNNAARTAKADRATWASSKRNWVKRILGRLKSASPCTEKTSLLSALPGKAIYFNFQGAVEQPLQLGFSCCHGLTKPSWQLSPTEPLSLPSETGQRIEQVKVRTHGLR